MHDIRFIRENPEAFDAGLWRRGMAAQSSDLLSLDDERKRAEGIHQAQLAGRNKAAKAIGAAKMAGDMAVYEKLLADSKSENAIGEAGLETSEKFASQLKDLLAALPNLPADDVPDGADELGNVELKHWGEPRRDNGVAEHFDIGAALGLDFESAQSVSGARFAYLRGPMARLNRALGQFMLDTHTGEFGYQEVAPPLLVRDEAVFGTAQLPKFAEDLFTTYLTADHTDFIRQRMEEYRATPAGKNSDEFRQKLMEGMFQKIARNTDRRWLIPTAEVSLTNLVREKILPEDELPLRFAALTPCFRSEAGAAGKDTRGLIRQHQFDKVELVSITRPEDSAAEHERMTRCAEHILEALELPYRRMLLCAGDMGFQAKKTFDLEVWLPGQGAYREISSCSNCGDFQARRMQARYRPAGAKGEKIKPEFVHTLNGSGLAVGRTLVAVLENYQQADGSVEIPIALRPHMGGITKLTPNPAAGT